ncbi:tRNA (adenine(58)-N(1))-methyltransferase catalytic subunit TRMT61A-like [Oppia nitens]|uniref:tRNA (adenine(58)-N(1))-methyltransferase catalytic subunit TRMT61A-like n=1 Tax=Oppia nitens TaxID=1686743 RepID=UPI0023DBADBC|nr:tRNA (adenine(58)-N(1))-methyltransferase catalytic subunit TRMT61A-like [Oppia nitens]
MFTSYKSLIQEGDTLVVYLSPQNIYPIRVQKGQVFQTKYGALRHDDIVGKQYGCVHKCSKGYVHILHITPELWTLTLPHRTQILYTTDISFIVSQLDLKPGSVVCEAGTGSGSLSHAIGRTIAPNGQLITYDFHEERASLARNEFADHGLSDIICAEHRDVCTDGFGFNNHFDALFLDLPHPWEAIKAAKEALKTNGGRICCFSPCMEQVGKTCTALTDNHFVDIDTYECLLRPYEVKSHSLPIYQFTNKQENCQQIDCMSESIDDEVTNDDKSAKKLRTESDNKPEVDDNSDNVETKSSDYMVTYLPNQSTGHTGFLTVAVIYD